MFFYFLDSINFNRKLFRNCGMHFKKSSTTWRRWRIPACLWCIWSCGCTAFIICFRSPSSPPSSPTKTTIRVSATSVAKCCNFTTLFQITYSRKKSSTSLTDSEIYALLYSYIQGKPLASRFILKHFSFQSTHKQIDGIKQKADNPQYLRRSTAPLPHNPPTRTWVGTRESLFRLPKQRPRSASSPNYGTGGLLHIPGIHISHFLGCEIGSKSVCSWVAREKTKPAPNDSESERFLTGSTFWWVIAKIRFAILLLKPPNFVNIFFLHFFRRYFVNIFLYLFNSINSYCQSFSV